VVNWIEGFREEGSPYGVLHDGGAQMMVNRRLENGPVVVGDGRRVRKARSTRAEVLAVAVRSVVTGDVWSTMRCSRS
jgi:citrate synthase